MEKHSYVVKGGCNLRFFFRSVHFSEDLDVDVHGIPVTTLRNNIDHLVRATAPKQIETTQRWKVTPVSDVLIRRYRLYPVIVQHYTAAAAIEQKVAALALRSQTQARDVFDLNVLLDAHAADRAEIAAAA